MNLLNRVRRSLREDMGSDRELTELELCGIETLQELFGWFPPDFFYTVGVYNDDSMKTNYVEEKHLASHIAYNIVMRPGRAFFVNFVCLNYGYLGEERCLDWQEKLAKKGLPEMKRNTVPYQ